MSEIGSAKTELDTPALWVDLDLLEQNIVDLARHFSAAGVDWRPHMKGVRVPAIAHLALSAGAIGVTCATIREAEAMANAGIRDILIANELVGERKIARLTQLCRHADAKVIVDGEANVHQLQKAAADGKVEIGILIDVDTGMQRTGLVPGQAVIDLAKMVEQCPNLRLAGLMAWEGHALAYNNPAEKERETLAAVSKLTDLAKRCRQAGLDLPIVSGGGSGTYKTTPYVEGMTEIQAGGAIFSDVAYQGWGVDTQPCLFVQTIVSSRPTADRIVIDAGFKTLPVWHVQPRAIGLEGVTSHVTSAEHGIITVDSPNDGVKAGDLLDFVVGYTDCTLFLHRKLYGIRRGLVETVWDII